MTGAQTELDALKADWELCKVQDDQKHSLISVRQILEILARSTC